MLLGMTVGDSFSGSVMLVIEVVNSVALEDKTEAMMRSKQISALRYTDDWCLMMPDGGRKQTNTGLKLNMNTFILSTKPKTMTLYLFIYLFPPSFHLPDA